jgi:hypothetical protein
VLLTVGGINDGVEVSAIPVALELAQLLELLAEGDQIGGDISSRDGGQEAEEDHADGQEEDGRTEHCFGLAWQRNVLRRYEWL